MEKIAILCGIAIVILHLTNKKPLTLEDIRHLASTENFKVQPIRFLKTNERGLRVCGETLFVSYRRRYVSDANEDRIEPIEMLELEVKGYPRNHWLIVFERGRIKYWKTESDTTYRYNPDPHEAFIFNGLLSTVKNVFATTKVAV